MIKEPSQGAAKPAPACGISPNRREATAEPAAAAEGKAAEKKPEAKPAAEPLPPEPLARLMSSDQVLLTDDPKGGWLRVAANQMLMPQRLLVLPTYRAKVTLTVGVTLEILGGTQIELLASGPQELPGIRVLYGRVVMMPLAKPGSRLRVAFGDRSGVDHFLRRRVGCRAGSAASPRAGNEPRGGPPHIVADLYATHRQHCVGRAWRRRNAEDHCSWRRRSG